MEEYLSHGSGRVPLSMAIDAAEELLEEAASGTNGSTPMPSPSPNVPSAADNERAMAELMARMGGTRG